MMDVSRNQYFLMGTLLLLLGAQFLMTDTFVLNPHVTQFLAEQTDHPVTSVYGVTDAIAPAAEPTITKKFKPPHYIGYLLTSLGAVLVLHSWGMKKGD
ncbi:MAG: hypothetical protein HQ567_32360 [Candidatus Nealsonbacteria bacterium]|nr:hypothetical protein [Candidatus Nealsonbacteria bacterium]